MARVEVVASMSGSISSEGIICKIKKISAHNATIEWNEKRKQTEIVNLFRISIDFRFWLDFSVAFSAFFRARVCGFVCMEDTSMKLNFYCVVSENENTKIEDDEKML